jgi:plastocyanin
MSRTPGFGLVAICGVLCAGCSGSATPNGASLPATPSGPGTSGAAIVITSTGVSPRNVTVAPGTQVTFTNNDSIEHLMFSDPHPEHTDCPNINQVGFLSPGQTRQTGNMTTIQTCGFHDHEHPLNTSLQGTITIR